jgi:DNA-directed RNA polymerase I subunit RPA1
VVHAPAAAEADRRAAQVGIPLRFAKRLSYPEPVTDHNAEQLAQMVRNGPDKHPGAVTVEDSDGRLIDLRKRNYKQRCEIASKVCACGREEVAGRARADERPRRSSWTRRWCSRSSG